MSNQDFAEKVVLVTGGGTGIGQSTAIAFARAGARVIVAGRRLEACQQTVKKIAAEDLPADEALSVDIGEKELVKDLFTHIENKYRRLDVAFLNAGIAKGGDITDQSCSDFEQTIKVNCVGLWLCLKFAMRGMINRGNGSIINTLSVHSMRPIFTGTAAYTASKHAALALTKSAAFEGAAHGVRVNGIAPGPIMTDMLMSSVDLIGGVDGWVKRIPQGRIGTTDEVADAVMWLASENASFVNGTVINIDGAFLAS